jgi:glutamate dehydrogenase
MHFEVARRLDEAELADLEGAVERILGDVRLAVRDFRAMRERVERMIELVRAASNGHAAAEVDETVSFLRWLLDMNFVFLGYGEYALEERPGGPALVVVEGTELGISSKRGGVPAEEPAAPAGAPAGGELMVYTKTDRTSTVHRRARMNSIGVPVVSVDGSVTGQARLIGLFTSKAYMEPAGRTPLLHRKLAQILEAEDLFEGSHDYKAVVSIFESFPKDELFVAPTEELRGQVMGLLALQEQRHVRLFVRRDLQGRSVSLLVVLPRDRFDAELRSRLQDLFMLRFNGSSVDYHLSLGESQLAQVHFAVHVASGHIPDVSFKELEEEVIELARTWDDRVGDRLVEVHGEQRGRELADHWATRFPDAYKHVTDVEVAVGDVERFEELEAGDGAFVVGLVNLGQGPGTLTRVRLYKVGGKIRLSDFVPTLESLGLQVVEEVPSDLIGDGAEQERFLHDFGVLGADGHPLDVETAGERIAECISAVWRGECESDSLNRLVVTAGLDWRQIQILRAYRKYHQRVNAGFPAEYKNEASRPIRTPRPSLSACSSSASTPRAHGTPRRPTRSGRRSSPTSTPWCPPSRTGSSATTSG